MLREKLGTAADVAALVVAVLVAAVLLKAHFVEPAGPDLLKPGNSLGQVDRLDLRAHKKSLLLVLRSGCGYCEGSTPFYRELAELSRSSHEAVRVVALFEDKAEVARQFLQENGVTVDVIAGFPIRNLKIGATPTLILVDDAGQVLKVWEGLLSRKAEDDVKAAITAQSTT